MEKRKCDIARELYEQGKTYEEIHQILTTKQPASKRVNFQPEVIRKIPYVGLRKWMLRNKVTMTELARRAELSNLRSVLMGKCAPRWKTIEAILSVTGLTYEECFNLKEGDAE